MEWKAELSNGEIWTRKQLYKKGDISEFRRLIRHSKELNVYIKKVSVLIRGEYIDLPENTSMDHMKFWYAHHERWAGGLGGGMRSVEHLESISYRTGQHRHYFCYDLVNDRHLVISLPINKHMVKESAVEKEYAR